MTHKKFNKIEQCLPIWGLKDVLQVTPFMPMHFLSLIQKLVISHHRLENFKFNGLTLLSNLVLEV